MVKREPADKFELVSDFGFAPSRRPPHPSATRRASDAVARMATKRQAGYRNLGYVVDTVPLSPREPPTRTLVVPADQ